MDIDISEEKLERINEVYETLGRIPIAAELAHEKIAREFDIDEGNSWINPIDTCDTENYFNRTREKMIRFVVRQICPAQMNFEIDAHKVVEYINETVGDEYFDAKEIRDHIKKEYIDKADELSLAKITTNAIRLLPIFCTDHKRREAEIDDILTGGYKKNGAHVLKLYAYMGWEHSFIDMSNFCDKVGAFEKLMDITMSKTLPSDAHTGILTTFYQNAGRMQDVSDEEEELLKRHYTSASRWIDSVKMFKNGRFDIVFRKHEDALKVGNALIDAQEPPIIY